MAWNMITVKAAPQQDLKKEVSCPRCGKITKEWRTTNCYSSRKSKLKTCGRNVCEDCIYYSPERHRSECVDCWQQIEWKLRDLKEGRKA